MHHRKYAFTLILLTVALLIVACQEEPSPTPTPDPVADLPTTAPEATVPASPTPEPDPTPTAEPDPTATPLPTPTPGPAYEPIFEEAACEFEEPFGYVVECGYLLVPENRDAVDNERTVRLHVAIFNSESDNPAPDPIVYLEGGPGGDALEVVPLIFEERFAPFLAERDFIMFDQRGTGYSEPSLACPEYTDLVFNTLDQQLPDEEEVALFEKTLLECRQRLVDEGIDLTAYNSAASAADVADLRQALEIDEWNLYGISYGTRLALTVMRDHPEGLRSVVLDSPYPLTVNLQVDTIANASRAFNVLFDNCAADPACAEAYPDLREVFFATVDALNEAPAAIQVIDSLNAERYDAVVNGETFMSVIFQSLYETSTLPLLPKMIYDVSNGRYGDMSLLLSGILLNTEFFSIGMQYSVQCHEEIVFTEPGAATAAAEAYPEFADFIDDSFITGEAGVTLCDQWAAGQADPIENEPVSSDLPTLILAGEYDPITPPAWGELLVDDLSNSYLFVFPATGHGASVSGECPRSVTEAFWTDPGSAPEAACVSEMASVAFQVPGGAVEAVTLASFTDDAVGIRGVAPESWDNVSPGVHLRGDNALDQTALVQVGGPAGLGDLLLETVTDLLGVEEIEESAGEYNDGSRVWQLYESETLGYQVDIGVTDTGDASLVVLMLSSPEERSTFYESVFLPALDALSPQ